MLEWKKSRESGNHVLSGFPCRLENLKNESSFFQSGKNRGNFEHAGKIMEFYTKY